MKLLCIEHGLEPVTIDFGDIHNDNGVDFNKKGYCIECGKYYTLREVLSDSWNTD